MNLAVSTDLHEARSWKFQVTQAIALSILYAIPVLFALRIDQVSDTDVWWHLRIGQWIVEHKAIPHTELFSMFASGKPWTAYSWLYELIVFGLFKKLGLIGIVVYSSTMAVAITVAVHQLVRRLNSDFTLGVGISFLSMYTMGRLFTPRPWLLTIFFFALELSILMRARRIGKTRELLWLPLIFVIWTNIHIQFVDGLLVLGIGLVESVAAQKWSAIETKINARWMVGIFLACLAATLLNPYGWTIYTVACDLVAQGALLPQIIELSPISFRNLDDWCLILIALAATAVLARARRFAFFETMLLAFSIVVSLRSQRDIWVLAIGGGAIIASGLKEHPANKFILRSSAIPFVASASALFVSFGFLEMEINNTALQRRLESLLPVQAVETIKQQSWGGPIYNDYNWGGFLIWSLGRPISMYGRNTDYGVNKVLRSNATWSGYPGWNSDPDLLRANLIIAPSQSPLVQLLRLQPCLRLAYQDQLATVFIPQKDENAETGAVATGYCAARDKLSNHLLSNP